MLEPIDYTIGEKKHIKAIVLGNKQLPYLPTGYEDMVEANYCNNDWFCNVTKKKNRLILDKCDQNNVSIIGLVRPSTVLSELICKPTTSKKGCVYVPRNNPLHIGIVASGQTHTLNGRFDDVLITVPLKASFMVTYMGQKLKKAQVFTLKSFRPWPVFDIVTGISSNELHDNWTPITHPNLFNKVK